jgi:hypothetical protein
VAKRQHWVESSDIVRTYFETEGRLQRLAENLGVGALVEDPLGCGAWGCAYTVIGSPLVVKITMDDDEGRTWRLLQEMELPGVPWIKEVVELTTPPGNMYAIVREGVDPLPDELRHGSKHEDSLSLHEWLGVYQDDAKNFYYYIEDVFAGPELRRMRGPLGHMQQVRLMATKEHLLKAAAELQEIPSARDLGLALAAMAKAGIPPIDVHDDNLGVRVHEEFGTVGQILFIDPGMTPAEGAPAIERRMAANRKRRVSIDELNAAYASAFFGPRGLPYAWEHNGVPLSALTDRLGVPGEAVLEAVRRQPPGTWAVHQPASSPQPWIGRRMAANGKCFFCGDPAAHPSTGVQRTENVLACHRCAGEFETWTRRREKGGRKGEPSFTAASLKYHPGKLEPNVRKKAWVEELLKKHDAIERAIEAPLGEMLGCGHWGCVFDSTPPWVVKLSIDPTEGPIWEKIINLINEEQYGADGFTRVKNVFRLKPDYVTPGGKSHKVWAIVREGIEPVYDDDKISAHTLDELGIDNPEALRTKAAHVDARTRDRVAMFTDALEGLSHYRHAAKAWHAFNQRSAGVDHTSFYAAHYGIRTREQAEDKIQAILRRSFDGPIAGPLGESLSMLASNGVYLRDVHYGNIGWRVPKDDDEWACLVIFDPGHTPTKGGKDIVEALVENGREAL